MTVWEYKPLSCDDKEASLIENLRNIDKLKSKDEKLI